MTWFRVRSRTYMSNYPGEHVFWNSGTVIECEEDAATRKFISTIIVAATIFVRTNGVQPEDIKVTLSSFDVIVVCLLDVKTIYLFIKILTWFVLRNEIQG